MENKKQNLRLIIIDGIMTLLILINLNLILFDWLFESVLVQNFLNDFLPSFYSFYLPIHENFLLYDLGFVAIFAVEIVVRWILSIKRKEFEKWYWYPFVHWYDVLGCIPVASFRSLRFLRLFVLLKRLDNMHIINLTRWYIYQKLLFTINVITEEVSDRVVLNILSGIQTEIVSGTPITDQILEKIIQPHKPDLVRWISARVRMVMEHNYDRYEGEIKEYVETTITESLRENKELANLNAIPIVGRQVALVLESAISDIVFRVIHKMATDLASPDNSVMISELTDVAIDAILAEDEDKELDVMITSIATQAIQIIKNQVGVKQWKIIQKQNAELAIQQQ